MRSSGPLSYATNQWLALSISVPQMSHEMAWRITEIPPPLFHRIDAKQGLRAEEESRNDSKSG
jgi:hypothetical protein